MTTEATIQLVSLGVKLATALLEKRSRAPVHTLTDDQILRLIGEIEIEDVDVLIAKGRELVVDALHRKER